MGSSNCSSNSNQNQTFKEEIKENSRIFDCNTVIGVDLNHLEEFMDTIFTDEVPKNFSDSMKRKIRVIKISDRADNFKGKEDQTGLESDSFECNQETHYFFFIAEKKENKMDISYKFFVGKAAILKAYEIIKGKKKVIDKNYKHRLKEVVNNPLCLESQNTIKTELLNNIANEKKLFKD